MRASHSPQVQTLLVPGASRFASDFCSGRCVPVRVGRQWPPSWCLQFKWAEPQRRRVSPRQSAGVLVLMRAPSQPAHLKESYIFREPAAAAKRLRCALPIRCGHTPLLAGLCDCLRPPIRIMEQIGWQSSHQFFPIFPELYIDIMLVFHKLTKNSLTFPG